MPEAPTHADAELVLHLYDLRREARMRVARQWFASSFGATTVEELERLCPRGSEENASFRMLTGYWDMAASFVTTGVLNRELFFQSGQEMLFVWEKIKTLVPLLRERAKNPMAYRHLEQVATAYIEWVEARAPEFYPYYSQAVAAMMAQGRKP